MTSRVHIPIQWGTILRRHGLRGTTPRLAVLDTLWHHPHSSVEQLLDLTKPSVRSLSFQTVYNIVHDLASIHLVRSLELPGCAGLYEIDTGDNHHHVVCTSCQRIADVECAVGNTPCLEPANDHGMIIEVADVIYRGICADCRAQANQSSTI